MFKLSILFLFFLFENYSNLSKNSLKACSNYYSIINILIDKNKKNKFLSLIAVEAKTFNFINYRDKNIYIFSNNDFDLFIIVNKTRDLINKKLINLLKKFFYFDTQKVSTFNKKNN